MVLPLHTDLFLDRQDKGLVQKRDTMPTFVRSRRFLLNHVYRSGTSGSVPPVSNTGFSMVVKSKRKDKGYDD